MALIPDIFLRRFLGMKKVSLQIGISMLTGMYLMLSLMMTIVNGTEFSNDFSSSHFLLVAIIFIITFTWLIAFLGAYLSSMAVIKYSFFFWTIFTILWITLSTIRIASDDKDFCVANRTRCAPTMWLLENGGGGKDDSVNGSSVASTTQSSSGGGGGESKPGGGEETKPGGGEESKPGGGEASVPGGGEESKPGGGEKSPADGGGEGAKRSAAREKQGTVAAKSDTQPERHVVETTEISATYTAEPTVRDYVYLTLDTTTGKADGGDTRKAVPSNEHSTRRDVSVLAITKGPSPRELFTTRRKGHAVKIYQKSLQSEWMEAMTTNLDGDAQQPKPLLAAKRGRKYHLTPVDGEVETPDGNATTTGDGLTDDDEKEEDEQDYYKYIPMVTYFLVLFLYSWFVLLSYLVELHCIKSCTCHQRRTAPTKV